MKYKYFVGLTILCVVYASLANEPTKKTGTNRPSSAIKRVSKPRKTLGQQLNTISLDDAQRAQQAKVEKITKKAEEEARKNQKLAQEAEQEAQREFQLEKDFSEKRANGLIDSFLNYIDKKLKEDNPELAEKRSSKPEETVATAQYLANFVPFLLPLTFIVGPKKLPVVTIIASVFILYKKAQADLAQDQRTAYAKLEKAKSKILYSIGITQLNLMDQDVSPDEETLDEETFPFIKLLKILNRNKEKTDPYKEAVDFVEKQEEYPNEEVFANLRTSLELNNKLKDDSELLINDLVEKHFGLMDFLQEQYKPEPKKGFRKR